ncbi:MAG: LPS assembly lipoprotein LptE [Gammaproteobacteria bacterium]
MLGAAFAGMSLGGCGFRLRTEFALPPQLARVHVNGADLELVARIADALAARGAVIDADGADLRITADMRRAVLSTDADGRATAYSLTYAVQYQLRLPGAKARPARSFSLRRAFDYAVTRQLQVEREAEFLEEDLRGEAAAFSSIPLSCAFACLLLWARRIVAQWAKGYPSYNKTA